MINSHAVLGNNKEMWRKINQQCYKWVIQTTPPNTWLKIRIWISADWRLLLDNTDRQRGRQVFRGLRCLNRWAAGEHTVKGEWLTAAAGVRSLLLDPDSPPASTEHTPSTSHCYKTGQGDEANRCLLLFTTLDDLSYVKLLWNMNHLVKWIGR